jgi:hypothetical protein
VSDSQLRVPSQHALAPAGRSGPLVALKLVDRIERDPAVAARVADDAVKRRERPRRGLRRATLRAQLAKQRGDVVHGQRRQVLRAERRQEVTLEVVAVCSSVRG